MKNKILENLIDRNILPVFEGMFGHCFTCKKRWYSWDEGKMYPEDFVWFDKTSKKFQSFSKALKTALMKDINLDIEDWFYNEYDERNLDLYYNQNLKYDFHEDAFSHVNQIDNFAVFLGIDQLIEEVNKLSILSCEKEDTPQKQTKARKQAL